MEGVLVSPLWLTQNLLFLVNQVEHKKLNQRAAELPFARLLGVQLCLQQTQALITTTNQFTIFQPVDKGKVIGTYQGDVQKLRSQKYRNEIRISPGFC